MNHNKKIIIKISGFQYIAFVGHHYQALFTTEINLQFLASTQGKKSPFFIVQN